MTLRDDDIYTLEAGYWDGAAEQTLRVADAGPTGFTTASTDTPPSVFYPSGLKGFQMQSRSAFGDRQTSGDADVAEGEVTVINENGFGAPFDQYRRRPFDGRMITVRRGQRAGAYPSSWRTLMRAPMHAPSWDHETLKFRVRDARKLTSVPLTTTRYAGTNSAGVGLEGTADDLKGKPKPVAMGRSFNAQLPCVNAQQQTFQISDNLATVSDVRDGGFSLGVSFPLTSRTVPIGHTADTFRDVAYGGGVYVAVGQDGSGYGSFRSTDGGTTWTAVNIAAAGTIANRVVYSESLGLFVAAGQGGKIYHSADAGVTWTLASTIPAPISGSTIAGLAWSPVLGLFLVGGDTGGFASSIDGDVWTNRVITANSWQIRRIVWGRDRFVLSGWDATGGVGLLAYSTIGTGSWTQVTSPILGAIGVASLPCLAYDSVVNRYVTAADGSTSFATSEDGITWTLRPSDGSTGWQAVASNGGLFVAVNSAHLVGTSYDGIAWTLQTMGLATSGTLRAVSIVETKVVILGTNNIWTSTDVATYATLADLQSNDATLVPAKGTYKIFSSSTGSYIRLGSPAIGTITADVVQGTIAADRTGAQLMVQAFKRAGLGVANIALWSEDLTNAVWTKNASTISANATTAPDGKVTADKLQEDNTNATHFALQSITCAVGTYTFSVYVKAAERTKCVVVVDDLTTGSAAIVVDLTNGATSASGFGVGSWTAISWYVEDARNGWYRVSVTGTRGANTVSRIYVAPWTTTAGYLGTTGNGIYVWGADLKAGALAKAYVPTTSAPAIGGDWSAIDILALDAANSAEMGIWFGPDDASAVCADVVDAAARSLGAMWPGDALGIIRTKRLIDPVQNLVASPDTLTAGAGWTVTGSVVPAAAFSTVNGISLTRLTAANTGQVARVINGGTGTLPTSGAKRVTVILQWDGVAGVTQHGFFDNTAGVFLASVDVTWTAGGVATAVATLGTLVRLASLGSNAYKLVMTTAVATAAHVHLVYPLRSATATSIRIGRVDVEDVLPVATFGENDLQGTLIPLDSGDPNEGIAPYRHVIQYAKNHTVQTSGIDGAVSAAERAQFALEWREASAQDAAVLAAHPLSLPVTIQTLFAFEADAAAEAARLQALKGVDREWYSVPATLTDASIGIELGDVIEIVNGRFGLDGGELVATLGIAPEFRVVSSINALTAWR